MKLFQVVYRIFKLNSEHKSRFHTIDGTLVPIQDILLIPFDVTRRLFGIRRKGPWMSRKAVGEIRRLLQNKYLGKARVLEVGGGFSTKWLKDRCGFLVTIEEDPRWITLVMKIGRAHV